MRRVVFLCLVGCSFWGCGGRDEIALDYELSGIDLSQVVRVETYIAVDSSDKRNFFADSPYRSVATGVGYEVRDFDGSGQRKVLITHDNTLGFVFTKSFTFTLLPPSGETAPPLVVNARAVGAAAMLGRTMDLPAHFAVNASVKVTLSDERCNGIACATNQACCNDACTNTKSDPLHCGGCDKPCAPLGDSCQGGSCLCAGGSACAGSQTCCPMVGCIDLTSDPFNCGACGNSCNPGESCSGGMCQCNGGAACGDKGLCCATTGCSTTGSCACGSSSCAAPNTCCNNSSCVNLMTDNNNCGACGKTCPSGLVCDNGACKCSGQICSQADTCCPTGCANLMSSTTNCGSCGHACAANEVCSSGTCKCGMTTCTTGQSCCGTDCKTIDSDPMNCGACGHACNAGEQCLSGHCICAGTSPPRACTGSETCCGGGGSTGGGNGCFDLSSNHDHCGQCTKACQATEMCTGGNCVQSACSPPCSNGNVCDPSSLTCKCGSATGCSDPNYCCNGLCVDRSSNQKNCGSCGNNVSPNLCCNSMSTPHDSTNCTACGIGCGLGELCCNANGSFMCVSGEASPNCGACGITCGGTITDGFKTGLGTCCQGCNGGLGFCSTGACPLCPAG